MSAPLLNIAAFNDWLSNGERGLSSEQIASTLTGVNIVGRWHRTHPSDPADFRRCEMLLRSVPEARRHLGELRSVSPEWAALVGSWVEIASTFEAELPGALTAGGRSHGSASDTYRLMRELIDGAR